MNKKLMAVAVAGVLTAPAALAQSSNVQLYGRANLGLDTYSATGATAGPAADHKSRLRVYDAASRVGLRGTEDLGGGLKAIFGIETGINIDGNSNTGQGGQTNSSSGFWATRDSWVGLDGGFGRLTFGRQSIWWVNGPYMQHGANYVNTDVPFLNLNAGLTAIGVARQNNVAAYTTPTFSGFNATLSWSPDAGGGIFGNNETAQAGVNRDARIWGATVRWYPGGPFGVQADYVQRKAVTPAAGFRQTNSGWKVVGGWTYMPGSQLGLIVGQAKQNDIAAAVAGYVAAGDDVKQNMYGIGWEHTIGAFQVMAQYATLRKVSGCSIAGGCDQTGVKGFLVGGRYFMSKRTWLYASYNQTKNEQKQTADYGAGAMTSAVPMAAGADPRIIALGLWHAF